MRPALASSLLLLACLAGCTDRGIGRPCIFFAGDLGIPQGSATLLSSPALECPSRLCEIQIDNGMLARTTCTDQCTTDDDCSQATIGSGGDRLCGSKFVCAVAVVTGGFKCKKVCVCHDDLVCGVNSDADGGVITPVGCPNPSPSPPC
jgi:hypothetical protein